VYGIDVSMFSPYDDMTVLNALSKKLYCWILIGWDLFHQRKAVKSIAIYSGQTDNQFKTQN
jgi:hypothetical protein